jgi:anti-sigma factor RsiW
MSAGRDMSCKELVEVITDYLEGTMATEDRKRFEAHLGLCPWHLGLCPFCVDYVQQMRATVAALGTLTEGSIAPQRREEVLSAFRGWRSA